MKEYELSILFHPDLEMNLDPALDKVKKLIQTNGGKITKEESDGKKRLAYSIGNNDFALYYYINAELPAEAPAKISSTLGITDEVIRYLIIKADSRRAKYAAAKAADEAESAKASAKSENTNQEKEA